MHTFEREAVLDRTVDALARHFPGMEPAIRAIARHAHESASHWLPDDRDCDLIREDVPGVVEAGCTDGEAAS